MHAHVKHSWATIRLASFFSHWFRNSLGLQLVLIWHLAHSTCPETTAMAESHGFARAWIFLLCYYALLGKWMRNWKTFCFAAAAVLNHLWPHCTYSMVLALHIDTNDIFSHSYTTENHWGRKKSTKVDGMVPVSYSSVSKSCKRYSILTWPVPWSNWLLSVG